MTILERKHFLSDALGHKPAHSRDHNNREHLRAVCAGFASSVSCGPQIATNLTFLKRGMPAFHGKADFYYPDAIEAIQAHDKVGV